MDDTQEEWDNGVVFLVQKSSKKFQLSVVVELSPNWSGEAEHILTDAERGAYRTSGRVALEERVSDMKANPRSYKLTSWR